MITFQLTSNKMRASVTVDLKTVAESKSYRNQHRITPKSKASQKSKCFKNETLLVRSIDGPATVWPARREQSHRLRTILGIDALKPGVFAGSPLGALPAPARTREKPNRPTGAELFRQ
jgi:hypothetical protein